MTAPTREQVAQAIHDSWCVDRDECAGPSSRDYAAADALMPLIRAAQAQAWDEGYLACSDDFEVHLNHPALACNCSTNPLAENPYRQKDK